jgi:hypothetical protein
MFAVLYVCYPAYEHHVINYYSYPIIIILTDQLQSAYESADFVHYTSSSSLTYLHSEGHSSGTRTTHGLSREKLRSYGYDFRTIATCYCEYQSIVYGGDAYKS